MARRKLKQTKAAKAARRRYRAKKRGGGGRVGAGARVGGSFLSTIMRKAMAHQRTLQGKLLAAKGSGFRKKRRARGRPRGKKKGGFLPGMLLGPFAKMLGM